jgi:hypothetical protein
MLLAQRGIGRPDGTVTDVIGPGTPSIPLSGQSQRPEFTTQARTTVLSRVEFVRAGSSLPPKGPSVPLLGGNLDVSKHSTCLRSSCVLLSRSVVKFRGSELRDCLAPSSTIANSIRGPCVVAFHAVVAAMPRRAAGPRIDWPFCGMGWFLRLPPSALRLPRRLREISRPAIFGQ